MTKKKGLGLAKKYALLTLGCLFLATGGVMFLSPFDLVTGGIFSIAIISQHFVYAAGSDFYVIDIVTWIGEVSMLILSFFTLGKRYTLRSLFTTLLYPALVTFLSRVPMINGNLTFAQYFIELFQRHASSDPDWGLRILAAIAGGVFIGFGVSICYQAGGSTGGLDVIASLVAKHTPIKEGTMTFVLDGTLVIVGVIVLRNLPNGLIGVLSAFTCSLVIQYAYVRANRFIVADIISCESDKIRKYVEEVMDRTTTVIQVTGGYTGESRTLLRVAFSRAELPNFRAYIAQVDPRAFVTFTQTALVNGEGFDPLASKPFKTFLKTDKEDEDLHGKP